MPRQGLDDLLVEPVLARDRLEGQAEAAPLQLGGVLEQPLVIDGEDVVGVPQQVRVVGVDDLLDLVHDVARRAAAMRVAEDGVAAPGARERAAARGDQRHRALAVVLAPDVDVRVLIDGGAIGEGLGVQVGDHRPRLGAHDRAVVVAVGDALDVWPGREARARQVRARAPPASARLRR